MSVPDLIKAEIHREIRSGDFHPHVDGDAALERAVKAVEKALPEIIAAIVPPLEWEDGDAISNHTKYRVYLGKEKWTLELGECCILTNSYHATLEDAKAAAQAHHVAQTLKACGLEVAG